MKITINGRKVEVLEGATLSEAARGAGVSLPSMCCAPGRVHRASCMVCAVKNGITGEIIPSCSTAPTDGMAIITDDDDVRLVRRLSLELLLSDHRADCDAPCTTVCPHGLDIEMILRHWDEGRRDRAGEIVAEVFDLPRVACDDCKAPCEKACRRRLTGGEAVEIREIVRVLATGARAVEKKALAEGPRSEPFRSRVGVLTPEESRRLEAEPRTESGCLHCACRGREGCRLREYAAEAGIKRTRYNLSSAAPVMRREHIGGGLWFEPAKCVRCGLCVAATRDGFTFSGRGFEMQVVLPEASRANVGPEVAEICPTGALYIE